MSESQELIRVSEKSLAQEVTYSVVPFTWHSLQGNTTGTEIRSVGAGVKEGT